MRGPASPETKARIEQEDRRQRRRGFVRLEVAAGMANRSRRAVNHWANEGWLLAVRSGGRTYVKLSDIRRVAATLGEVGDRNG